MLARNVVMHVRLGGLQARQAPPLFPCSHRHTALQFAPGMCAMIARESRR